MNKSFENFRIGLNATCFTERSSGAKNRFLGIYLNLIKLLPNSVFIIYEPKNYSLSEYFSDYKNIILKKTPINSESYFSKIIVSYFFWSNEFKKEKFDLFEFFSLPIFTSNNCKTLMTIHDIRGIHNQYNFFGKMFYKFFLNYAVIKAHKIITVSKFMKKDILNFHPKANIDVIYNGVSIKDFMKLSDKTSDQIIKKMNLPTTFILSIGHFEKRKNFPNLIKAFAIVKKKHPNVSLIIIGNDANEKIEIIRIIHSLKLSKSVFLFEGISDLEVRAIYKKAKLFIFPSLYEGFGIPVLESMMLSCPIVLSNIDVFKEITENKIPYFDPYDLNSIANTIDKYLLNSSERAIIIKYGQERVRSFDYKKIAQQVKSLYISILNK